MQYLKDRGFVHPHASDITPRDVYEGRRALLHRMAAGAAGAVLAGWAGRDALAQVQRPGKLAPLPGARSAVPGALTMEKLTAHGDVTSYNNFYEFGTDKSDPARAAGTLKTRPWTVAVEGEVKKPRLFDIDELLRLAPMEERIYRLRCVEGWSMVIPWLGFPLDLVLKQAEPLGSAKYVEFVTAVQPEAMPGVRSRVLDWPYVEGLRLDEARHPLTLLVLGLYGDILPNGNGAPLRIAVPWKYGFKSAKSITTIRFVEHEPRSSWMKAAPREYGFYSNVNPDVPHPRWSQAKERRIGEFMKRDTVLFNGYGEQVASLYSGMDLKKHF